MRFETRTAADLVLYPYNLMQLCSCIVTVVTVRQSVRHTPPPHAPRARAPAPATHTRRARLRNSIRYLDGTPQSSAGGARGARRHRPHVPTFPYRYTITSTDTSHAHTEHRIPSPVDPAPLLHPRRLCICMRLCGSPTQTRVRAHGSMGPLCAATRGPS